MKRFGFFSISPSIGGAMLGVGVLLLSGVGVSARQYVSLAPNYSALQMNAALDYWTFDHSEGSLKRIADLWDMPNAEMFVTADFDCCVTNYNKSDKKISYLPSFTLGEVDFPGRMELKLSVDEKGKSPWRISRVEIYAVNAFDPDWNYHPSFTVNGIKASLPEGNNRDYCGVDFPTDVEPVTSLLFETPAGSRVSFWDMKIYLYGGPQLPEDYVWDGVADYGDSTPLSAPVVKIGTLDPASTGRLQCSILDADGEIVAYSDDASSGEFLLDTSMLEVGAYSVCYHIPDPTLETHIDRCVPDAEDGMPLMIRPSFTGIMINGVSLDAVGENGTLEIPSVIEGESTGWARASLGGLRDGAALYWRCSLGEARIDAPSGYTLYDAATGINLENGNRLHLILEKNGVRSEEMIVAYARPSVEVGVETVVAEEEAEWYTVDGLPADPASVRKGEILVRRTSEGSRLVVMPDGN